MKKTKYNINTLMNINMNMKLTFSAIAGLFFCTAINAQYAHEFSLYGGGGLSTLNYNVTAGKQNNGFGGKVGLGYQFFFSKKFGLGTGAELALYNSKYTLDNLSQQYMTTDMEGTDFEFRSAITNYKETQQAMLLQIPLMLQFQTGSKHQFYAALGGKAGIPLYGKSESSSATIVNSGYYPEENYEYTTQEFMGFGAFTGRNADNNLNFKMAFFASAEAGVKWKLKNKLALYTGAYLDYGLNNIYKENSTAQQFVAYNTASPRDFTENSIFASQYTQNGNSQYFTEKITPLAVGIKIKLAFGFGSRMKKAETPATEPVQPSQPLPVVDSSAAIKAAQIAAEKAKADSLAQVRQAETARQQAAAKLQAAKTEIQQPIQNYTLEQIELTDIQKQELDKKIALLQQYPDLNCYIYGHTCTLGSDKINEKVGLQRAQKAKEYMLSKGIAENRILGIASKSDTEPLVPNISEADRRQNRRVELSIGN